LYNQSMLTVSEIYKTIQGESTYAGLPCVMVRLTGCNLRCVWCDSTHAFYSGKNMTREEVVRQVSEFKIPLVEITGGEPLLQADVYPLMEDLIGKNFTVLLETSGSVSIENVPRKVVKIMDLKCPGSGENEKNHFDNLRGLADWDEVKFVISDRTDYEWSRDTVQSYAIPPRQVLFSPVFDRISLRSLADWILADNLGVRLQTQLHKHIWDKNAVGV